MHALDITVRLDTPDAATFSAHSLGVAARLAAWPGAVCTEARVDAATRSFSARCLVSGRRRLRSSFEADLERLLHAAPSVTGIRVNGRTLGSVGRLPGREPDGARSRGARRFDTVPSVRIRSAA